MVRVGEARAVDKAVEKAAVTAAEATAVVGTEAAVMETAASLQRPARRAAATPRLVPTTKARKSVGIISIRVAGSRSKTRSVTGRLKRKE